MGIGREERGGEVRERTLMSPSYTVKGPCMMRRFTGTQSQKFKEIIKNQDK